MGQYSSEYLENQSLTFQDQSPDLTEALFHLHHYHR
jgi:hypothetical protein